MDILSPPSRFSPLDAIALLLLGLAGTLSRLPFLSPLIDSHDAANYALGLSSYDVGLHQPQPPGYPLYIFLGKAALFVAGDARLALVGLSGVMSGLAACMAYLTGRALWGRSAGAAAAMLLFTSPFIWAQGTAPSPYTADLFFSLLAGWACVRAAASRGEHLGAALLAGVTLGAAVLLRQQNAALLAGLLLHAVWGKPPRFWLAALGAAGLLTTVALLLPPLLSTGGLGTYMEALTRMSPSPGGSLGPGGVLRASRLDRLLALVYGYLGGTVGLAGIPLALAGAAVALTRGIKKHDTSSLRLLLLWALPAWIFFLLIKQGNQATVLVITPPIFLLMGLAAAWCWQRGGTLKWLGPALVLGLALHQTLIFTTGRPLPLAGPHLQYRAEALTRERHDLTLRLDRLRQLPPGDTIVIARSARLLAYHLPEWEIFTPPRSDPAQAGKIREVVRRHRSQTTVMVDVGSAEVVHPGTKYLVLVDVPFKPSGETPSSVQKVGLSEPLMKVVRLAPGTRVTIHAGGMDLEGSLR